jgi:hypothetical protein
VKRDGTYPSFLPNPVIRTVEKFVRRLPGFIVFLTRPLISVSARRWCARVDGGQRDVQNGSMIKLPSFPPTCVLLSSILPEDRDSFGKNRFPSNYSEIVLERELSFRRTLKLNLSYLIFVISNFPSILL